MTRRKNPAAVALGRLAGRASAKVGGPSKGGKARARKLSAEQLAAIGRKGAAARWWRK